MVAGASGDDGLAEAGSETVAVELAELSVAPASIEVTAGTELTLEVTNAGENLLVQSELYLGPQGEPGDLAKMQDEDFDAVVFNGYVDQYRHAPIRVEPAERIRVWVVDDGPSESSSFHIVGTVFDSVYKEGAYQLRPR